MRDFLIYCALAFAGIMARFGYNIGNDPPPIDPEARKAWRMKQLWAAIGEFCTIPMFGAAWVAAVHKWQLPIEFVIAGCLISGALGFGFWMDAIMRLINRKIDNV